MFFTSKGLIKHDWKTMQFMADKGGTFILCNDHKGQQKVHTHYVFLINNPKA